MPTYEYVCKDCQLDFTEERSISEGPRQADCPMCGKTLARKFGVGSINFAGEGFYTTDKKKSTKDKK